MRTRKTEAVRPETKIVEGYGLAAPKLGMVMGAVLVNRPEGAMTRVTWVAMLFRGSASASVAMARAELVIGPDVSARATSVMAAPEPGTKVPRLQKTMSPTWE